MPELIGLHRIEPNSNQKVGAAETLQDESVTRQPAADTEIQRMILRENAFGFGRHKDRHAKRLDEASYGHRRDVRVEIKAENHNGPACLPNHRRHELDRIASGGGWRIREQADKLGVLGLKVFTAGDIAWQRQMYRSKARLDGRAPRAAHG